METQTRYNVGGGDRTVKPDESKRVLSILEKHQGQRQAVTSRAMSRVLGMSTRKVRAAIAELVESGTLIGASVEGVKGGYYMITSLEELEATRAVLRSRASEIYARDAALRRAWQEEHGQEIQPLLPHWQR